MKHLNQLIVTLFLSATANVQAQCWCESVNRSNGNGFTSAPVDFDEKQAASMVGNYVKLFNKDPKKDPAKGPQITVKIRPANCDSITSAIAILCAPNEQKYIFYNKDFFNKLRNQSQWGDQFVLAHEIAHHVLGHPVWFYYASGNQLAAPNNNYQSNQTASQKGKSNEIPPKYMVSLSRRHLHELEADAVGLMMIRRKGVSLKDIDQIFDALPNILSIADINRDEDSHPSLNIRRKLIQKQWAEWENESKKQQKTVKLPKRANQKKAVYTETPPDTTQSLLADYIDIEAIPHKTEAAYSFYLLNADAEERSSLNNTETVLRNSLAKRARYSIDPLIGIQFQRPEFFRNDKSITATANRNIYIGVRAGIGTWYRPHRFEADLVYSVNAFNTQEVVSNQSRTAEIFRMKWGSLRPRYVFTYLIHRSPYRYRTHGFMFTGGFSLKAPIGQLTYENYGTSIYQAPTLKPSVSWVAGAGYTLRNWRNNGQIRLSLLYEPQILHFQTDAPDCIRATLNTYSLEVSAHLW